MKVFLLAAAVLAVARPGLAETDEAGAPEQGAATVEAGVPQAAGQSLGGAGLGSGAPSGERAQRPGVSTVGAGGSGGGGAAGSPRGGTAKSAGPSRAGLKFSVHRNLASMPEHALAHGIMRFAPNSGHAVGFVPGNGGYCAAIDSPAAPAKPECVAELWISETPGGPPPKGCSTKGSFVTGGLFVRYSIQKAPFVECTLKKPWVRHYCNVAVVAGWAPGVVCNALMNSPLGTPEELAPAPVP